jgi:hypothetical protein
MPAPDLMESSSSARRRRGRPCRRESQPRAERTLREKLQPRPRLVCEARLVRRLSTETKAAFKTAEFWAMAVVIVGILVAAAPLSSTQVRAARRRC